MQFLIMIILKVVDIYSYILVGYALLSWVPPLYNGPLGHLLGWLVAPIVKPFRRLNLQFLGVDWTLFLVMILLHAGASVLIRLLLLL
ncbi:TPA: YggT family protein [Streptococcus suis]